MKTLAGLSEEVVGELIEQVGAREERRAVIAYLEKAGLKDFADDIRALRHLAKA
jgi:hypothetical protein